MNTTWTLLISVVLLGLNGFFVAAEFALIAAKRHRLEEAAATGSRAGAAALAGSRELSMMLAGAQLGITLCTLGLGALAKPAVADLLGPLLDRVGLPSGVSYVVAFMLAVALVAFLHVVVGEIAPKSWAISHPVDSALLLALPFRAFARVARPAIVTLNSLANACVRAVGVTPQDELAQVHGPRELRLLLDSSREHGTLEQAEHELLSAMLQLQRTTLEDVMVPLTQVVTITEDQYATDVERVSRDRGRSRLVVIDDNGQPVGVVHMRDAVRATTAGNGATVGSLMTTPLRLSASEPVAKAVTTMRRDRAQLAVVVEEQTVGMNAVGMTAVGMKVVGIVALEDLIEEIIGEFYDESDPNPDVRQSGTSV